MSTENSGPSPRTLMRTSNEMAMNDLREVERPKKQEEKMPSDTSFAPFRMLDSVRLGHWPKKTEMAPVTRYSPIQETRTLDRTMGSWVRNPCVLKVGSTICSELQLWSVTRLYIMSLIISLSLSPSLPLPSLSLSVLVKKCKLLDDLEREIIHQKFVHRISI